MNYIDINRQKNINSIISIVKLGSAFFCLVIILNKFLQARFLQSDKKSLTNMLPIIWVFVVLLIVVYLVWTHVYMNWSKCAEVRTSQIIESLIFVLIFSGVTVLMDSYKSNFKFIFIFIIISATIQLGMKFGMAIATLSSFVVLVIDLAYAPSSSINVYFQNDLMMATGFFLISWSLGQYVKIENDNLNEKNEKLQVLENKLTEQSIQHKYIEEMLIKNEECYNLLIKDSQDAIFIHRDGKLIFLNESAMELIGVSTVQDVQGKSMLNFGEFKSKAELEEKYSDIYNNKLKNLTFEEKIVGADGKIVIAKNISTYFVYEGQPTILTILRDITSEKEVKQLQVDVERNIELLNETREFNKLITEFFSNISHELKTPLNIIFSSIQLLKLYNNDSELEAIKLREKYFSIMKQNCYRLMRLINNLLEMTKVDAGFIKLKRENCDIVKIVENITQSVVPYAESKNINIIFDTDTEEKNMAIDPDKIERITLNLLSNALKFTDSEGYIYINIYDLGDRVEIRVKDTGIGIPEDKIQFIFERFGQVDKSLTRNHEGTGIGLSLVKSFVDMHEGTIEVKSKLLEGSEFVVTLPVVLIEDENIKTKIIDDNIIERINIEFSDIYS